MREGDKKLPAWAPMSSVGYRPALHDGICFRCKGVGELRHQCPYGHVNPGPRSYASAVQVPAVGKSPPPQAVIKPVEGPTGPAGQPGDSHSPSEGPANARADHPTDN